MPDADPTERLRVLLVEDHASFRQAIAFVLDQEPEFQVVTQVGSLAEARRSLEGFDVAVVDLALPDGNGADLLDDLHRRNPGIKVLVLSATLNRENFKKVVEAGAAGVLDKLAGVDEIVNALRRLEAGAAMPRQREIVELLHLFDRQLDGNSRIRTTGDALSPREREVLQALAEGLDSSEVADKLGITSEEEQVYIASVLDKLGARSRLQALAIAARDGIVEIP